MSRAWIEKANSFLLGTYARPDVLFVRGQGSYLFDADGKKYLDFVSGIAVNALGHNHPAVVQAIQEQVGRLIHASNLYHTEPQARLASLLCAHSFADRVFFCNSGTEAVEGALKFARKWAKGNGRARKSTVVAFKNSFHGRTFAALTVTGQRRYRRGFAPLLPGVRHAVFNDLDSARQQIDRDTAAVLVEPVQGEGGVHPAEKAFLHGLRELCDQNEALLIFDEVQCGLGRTGDLFAYLTYGVRPDLVVLAKPLGGGLPLGAILLNRKVASAVSVGDHGSTFGGNPVACAAGEAVFNVLTAEGFLEAVREKSRRFQQLLRELARRYRPVQQVRGIGLMWGLEFDRDVDPVVRACRERGMLLCSAGRNVLRFLPPLTVSEEELENCLSILAGVLYDLGY